MVPFSSLFIKYKFGIFRLLTRNSLLSEGSYDSSPCLSLLPLQSKFRIVCLLMEIFFFWGVVQFFSRFISVVHKVQIWNNSEENILLSKGSYYFSPFYHYYPSVQIARSRISDEKSFIFRKMVLFFSLFISGLNLEYSHFWR